MGALLRREGLYSSHIAAWRAAEARGELASAESKRRGPKPKVVDPSAKEAEQLRRRVAHAEQKLEHAQGLIEIQKKLQLSWATQSPTTPRCPHGSGNGARARARRACSVPRLSGTARDVPVVVKF